MFGGFMPTWETSRAQWEWDGTAWTRRAESARSWPPSLTGAASVFDSSRSRVVMFGGHSLFAGGVRDDTWEWDGSTWNHMTTAVRPRARSDHALVYDVARSRTVLFGGFALTAFGDTWEWDGNQWASVATGGIPPRSLSAAAYDVARGRVIVHGGRGDRDVLSDTWEYDGLRWRQIATSGPPVAGASMFYDPTTQRIILFGGFDGSSFTGATWALQGGHWTRLAMASAPSRRAGAACAYDPLRGRAVLTGG